MTAGTGKPSRNWTDLRTRLITSALIGTAGIFAVLTGGIVFLVVAAVVSGVVVWEIARMCAPRFAARAVALGAISAAAVGFVPLLHESHALALGLVTPVLGFLAIPRRRLLFFGYSLAVEIATFGLTLFREDNGVLWLIWLILCVMVTDVFGYFAGRYFGGPKFWPQVSPSKTWSGTSAGWIAAGLVGAVFLVFTTAGRDIVWISMLLSLSSQMGDIAESWLKRRVGVKDSSNLLPGHGGLFDRFDGLLGGSLFLLVVAQFTPIPGLK